MRISGRILQLEIGEMSDKGTLILEIDSKQSLRALADQLSDKELSIDIEMTTQEEQRSKRANRYAWALIGEIAREMRVPAVRIYKDYVRTTGVYKDRAVLAKAVSTFRQVWAENGIGWTSDILDKHDDKCLVRFYYGSSTFNKKQMARLIDIITQDAEALGLPTLESKKIEEMIAEWE